MATLVKVHTDGREEFKEQGSRCEAIKWDDDGQQVVVGDTPTLGASFLVGSVTARSYSSRDWWLTTAVTKIVEKTDDHILFETVNSKYKLLR